MPRPESGPAGASFHPAAASAASTVSRQRIFCMPRLLGSSSPSCIRFRSRSATGSMPSFRASMSSSDSMANTVCGCPGDFM